MYRNITSNKRKTAFLILFFMVFIAALGFAIGYYLDFRYGINSTYSILLMVLAFIIALLVSISGYYYSDRLVIGMTGAREVKKGDNPRVYYMLEGLSIASGLPVPKLYIIEDKGMNAFATGRNPSNSIVCLTRGLIENLDDEELKGVIAHELSHIKNYDILLGTIIVILVGMTTIASNVILRSFFFGGRGRKSSKSSGGGVIYIIVLVIGLLLIILSPIIATLIRLAISRRREFLADADGALATRYPAGLASALKKISANSQVRKANNATAHLFIANPFSPNKRGALNALFNTHPPVEERINRLEEMSLGIGVK